MARETSAARCIGADSLAFGSQPTDVLRDFDILFTSACDGSSHERLTAAINTILTVQSNVLTSHSPCKMMNGEISRFMDTGTMKQDIDSLEDEIRACRLCAGEFRRTATAHDPRPVPWLSANARILIVGQAPGARVHRIGRPFADPSGDRLRSWLGVTPEEFYDRRSFAILPMAFCFPGYDESGSDLPPPPLCAQTWRRRVLDTMPELDLTVLAGGHAQAWHFDAPRRGVTETVRNWREYFPGVVPLPHPSWRNNGWLRKKPFL